MNRQWNVRRRSGRNSSGIIDINVRNVQCTWTISLHLCNHLRYYNNNRRYGSAHIKRVINLVLFIWEITVINYDNRTATALLRFGLPNLCGGGKNSHFAVRFVWIGGPALRAGECTPFPGNVWTEFRLLTAIDNVYYYCFFFPLTSLFSHTKATRARRHKIISDAGKSGVLRPMNDFVSFHFFFRLHRDG